MPSPGCTGRIPPLSFLGEALGKANTRLAFTAPGDDLLCGTADAYELVHSNAPITAASFSSAEPLTGAPAPARAGTRQSIRLPGGARRYVALRARDEQGADGHTNVGRPLVAARRGSG